MSIIPSGWAQFERDVHERIAKGVEAAAAITKAHLDEPGSGIHWPWLPHRSSARGEYPARQFGPLEESIGSRETGPMQFEVGSINNTPPEAIILEFSPESMGGRPWLSKSLEDPETHSKMMDASAGRGGG